MWRKVKGFIEEYKMLAPGDRVVVALSGGADSVCLLSILSELSQAMGLEIRAVHINHGLRGAEAQRDVDFVRGLCGEMQVPLEVVCHDVAAYAHGHKLSVEAAGRALRYQVVEASARQGKHEGGKPGPVWIGVAHHQDDNAETILHHLLRGSGLKGLGGILPVQGDRIRPLLCVRKEEILSYNRERGLTWCEDSTNGSRAYTRNRIRKELIPYMAKEINPKAVENILHAGKIFSQADQYLGQQALQVWQEAGKAEKGGAVSVHLPVFLGQEAIIQVYVLRHMVALVPPGQKDITARHLEQLRRLAVGSVGGRCDLPGGREAVRGYEFLSVGRRPGKKGQRDLVLPAKAGVGEALEVALPAPGSAPVRAGGMEFQAFFWEKGKEIPKKEYTKWFDYDKIKDTLFIRTRQEGDYLILPGGGRKMVNRLLIDEKVPRELRDQVLLLAEGHQTLWVTGYRISEYYKITEGTHTILQVEYYGGKRNGR